MSQPNPIETPEPAVTTDIAEYRPIAAALHDLYTRHAGVVHDVTTTQGMQACRAARAEIRTCRTSLEAKRQEIKAPALERCRLIDADAKRITEALRNIEDPLDAQMKAEEEAAETRREAKRRADMEKQAKLRHMVESINAWPLSCLGSTADEIREAITGYEQTGVPSTPEVPPHYAAEAASAKMRALDKLREMLATRVEWEAEQAAQCERQAVAEKRLREERERVEALRQQAVREAAAERERWAKEQATERAEAERRAAEARAELDRQRVEHARIEREVAEERARIAAEHALARERLGVPWEPSEAPEPPEPSVLLDPSEPFEPSEPQVSQVQAAGFLFPAGATVMRVRFEKRGGHYHCRVFTAKRVGLTFAKNGELVFDEAEWPDIPLLMRGADFVEEAPEWP